MALRPYAANQEHASTNSKDFSWEVVLLMDSIDGHGVNKSLLSIKSHLLTEND